MEYQVTYRLAQEEEDAWRFRGIYTSRKQAEFEANMCDGQARIDVFDDARGSPKHIATLKLVGRRWLQD